MATYRMTPARRAALRKAQLASARKRKRGKRKGKLRKAAKIGAAVAVAGGVGYATYKNKDRIKKQAAKNPYIRKKMAKRLLKQARARRAKRGR